MPQQRQYVFCPSCGDPVPGPFPRSGEFIHCTHCQNMFAFDAQAVETALIEYRAPEGRWMVVPIHNEMDVQATRILNFCAQAAPGCIVHVMPLGPDSFKVKVKNEGDTLISTEQTLYTHELAAKSDEELWNLLETVSNQRIKRTRVGDEATESQQIKAETSLKGLPIRVLVVDDYEPWRRFVTDTLRRQPDLQIIGEASDGLEAVYRAQKLEPDLILLDIGLPTLSGIQAARQIRQLSPKSTILFLSENRSWDVAKEALRSGGSGYVVKSHAVSDLLRAVDSALNGKQFISASLAGHDPGELTDEHPADRPPDKKVVAPITLQNVESARHHEAGFYSDDRSLLDGLTQFIGAALKIGNSAIVVATESHREGLLPRLYAYGLDVGAAIEQGRYIALDAADMVSRFMVNDLPDPARFLDAAGDLIEVAGDAAKGEHPRVAICGECEPPLWTIGNGEVAIRLEQLWNKITNTYNVDVLCAYPLRSLQGIRHGDMFQRICAEHSTVHFR